MVADRHLVESLAVTTCRDAAWCRCLSTSSILAPSSRMSSRRDAEVQVESPLCSKVKLRCYFLFFLLSFVVPHAPAGTMLTKTWCAAPDRLKRSSVAADCGPCAITHMGNVQGVSAMYVQVLRGINVSSVFYLAEHGTDVACLLGGLFYSRCVRLRGTTNNPWDRSVTRSHRPVHGSICVWARRFTSTESTAIWIRRRDFAV